MINVLAVFIGGGLGSVFRYLTSLFYIKVCDFNFPIATFSVNVLGAFLIGVFMGYLFKLELSQPVKYALTIGFCGGLTTFSTFSFEVFDIIKRGEYFIAAMYVFLSIFVTVIAAASGFYWARTYV